MNLKKRVDAIQEKINPNPQSEAQQENFRKMLEAARKRVEDGYKREGRALPLCWGKPFKTEEEPSISGKKPDVALLLEEARENWEKRCMSCSEHEKCEHSHYRISKKAC